MTGLSDKKKIVYPDLGEMGVIGYEVLMPEDVKEAIKELKKEDVYDLAKYMHDVYEAYAKANGWKTQDSCKVDFDFLPEKNKQVMINTALQVITKNNIKIDKIFGKELV